MIVHADVPVTLIGGAEFRPTDLAAALTIAPRLVAADGGAAAALAAGHLPEAVIGDLDSLPDDAASRLADRLHRIDEQDTTDFDKALRSIVAPLVVAVGFTGGRIDHALAVLHSLLVHAHRPAVLLGGEDLLFHCPPDLSLDLIPGTRVSLFPLGPVRVRSTGLAWPTDDIAFAPGQRIGTSNCATGPVRLIARAPGMLTILPAGLLSQAAQALLAAPRWPGAS